MKYKYLVHFQTFVVVKLLSAEEGQGNLLQDSVVLEAGKVALERDVARWATEIQRKLLGVYAGDKEGSVQVAPVSVLNFNRLEEGYAHDA